MNEDLLENGEKIVQLEIEAAKSYVSLVLEKEGHIAPMVVVLGYRDPSTGETHNKLGRIFFTGENLDFGGDPDSGKRTTRRHEENKNQFADGARAVAARSEPFGVAFVSECWVMRVPVEDADRVENQWKGGIHLNPNREEVVMITFEHYSLAKTLTGVKPVGVERYQYMAPMKRDGDKVTVGEWQGEKLENPYSATGRMVGFLPPLQVAGQG